MIAADPNCYEQVIGELSHYINVVNDQLNHIQSILPDVDQILVGDVMARKSADNHQKNMEQLRADLNILSIIRTALQEELQAMISLPTFIP